MRVVVLGAGGWLGSAIWQVLESGAEDERAIQAFGRSDLTNVTSAELHRLLAPGPDLTVVNAVGLLRGYEETLRDANLTFVETLTQALRDSGAYLVHFGSAAEYGDHGESPINEAAERKPATHYGRFKAESSSLVLDQPQWCVLRPFNVIDTSMVSENPIAVLRDAIRTSVGTVDLQAARARRDHVSRGFVTQSALLASRTRPAGAFNLCSGTAPTYADIAQAIAQQQGREVRFNDLDLPGIRTVIGDPSAWARRSGTAEHLDAADIARLVIDTDSI